MLKECSNWTGDGIFRSVPILFSQLYTIHRVKNKRSFPLVYILMADRSKESYIEVLKLFKSLVLDLRPERIMIDYEMALNLHLKMNFQPLTLKTVFFISNNVCGVKLKVVVYKVVW